MATTAPTPVFTVKGFNVTGDNPLSQADTTKALAPFLRTDATIDTLQKAVAALELEMRNQGYALHRVALPAQELSDTVNLQVVKFTMGTIKVSGLDKYTESNIRNSVPELKEGGTPNFRKLAVQTAIANENEGKQIQVALKESEQPDKIDADISVKEQKPWNFSTSLANTGNKASGRDRFTVAGGYSNLFDMDQQFVGAYTTSLEKTSSVKQLGLSYRAPIYPLGGVVGASYTTSDVEGNFGAFNSTGAGNTLGVNYSYYLQPVGGYRSYITGSFDNKVFDGALINGLPIATQTARRSTPLRLAFTARNEADAAFWSYSAEVAANTGMGSNNDLASYKSEDPRITTSSWKALRLSGNYIAGFAGSWLWSVRGQFQYSPDALISGEQLGLGGLSSIRGTSERPISGDSGLVGTAEITTPEIREGLRFVGFVDSGLLKNHTPNATTKPSSDHLTSAGFGLRFTRGQFAASVDYARLLVGSRVPLTVNSSSPQKDDDKLHVNLSLRF